MRITRLLLFAVLAGIAGIGCADVLSPRLDEGDLAVMRVRWEMRRPANYSFDLQYWNEWVSPETVRITVRNHAFHSARSPTAPGMPVDHESFTMDSLFALAERLQPDTALRLDLRFDSRTGMISRLHADWPRWADESYGYLVTRFVAQ